MSGVALLTLLFLAGAEPGWQQPDAPAGFLREPVDCPKAAPAFPLDTGRIDHEEFDINVRLFPSRYYLEGVTRIAFSSRVAGLDRAQFVLYNDTLVVCSVTSGAETLDFAYDPGSLTLTIQLAETLDQGQQDTVTVVYHGYITPALANSLNNYCRLDVTMGFSILPYVWYPSPYDYYYGTRRDDRFMSRTTLTVPSGWRAVGIGGLADSSGTDSTRTYVWQTEWPAKNACFSAGPFLLAARRLNGLMVRYYDFDTTAAGAVFQAAGSMLRYYDRMFGPCLIEKLAYAENGQQYGAAAASLIMMPLPYQLSGMAHETAHQWWGHAVQLRHTLEVWLNEGFASYCEALYQEDTLGVYVRWAELDTMARRYRNVPRAQDRPIVPAPTGSNYHFTIVYNKGAWVLHMLRWVLGDSTFFQALGEYSQQGRDSSVTVAGFATVAEQVSGTELDWFFDEWLYHIGYPKYHLDWSATPAGDSVRVVLGVSQVNGSGAPYLFRTPLPVKLNIPGPDTTLVVRPAANPQVDTFTVAGYPTGLAIDPDDWVLDSSYVTHAGVVEPSGPGVRPSVFEATVVRGTLPLPWGASTSSSPSWLLDATGRKVMELRYGDNDVRGLVPGVYFVTEDGSRVQRVEGSRVQKVVLTR